MSGRHANQDRIDGVIAEWVADREPNGLAAELQALGVSAFPVMTPLSIARDEHLNARGFLVPYSHPDTGDGQTTLPAWRFFRRPATQLRSAPRFGEHTREVLTSVAGYSEAEVDSFAARSITTDDLIPGLAG